MFTLIRITVFVFFISLYLIAERAALQRPIKVKGITKLARLYISLAPDRPSRRFLPQFNDTAPPKDRIKHFFLTK